MNPRMARAGRGYWPVDGVRALPDEGAPGSVKQGELQERGNESGDHRTNRSHLQQLGAIEAPIGAGPPTGHVDH
jgi:hypothetical protein